MRISAKVAVVLIVLVIAVIGSLFAVNWLNPGFTPLMFDKDRWSVATSEERGHMVDDLLSKHDLRGSTETEVANLLGDPDEDQTDLRRYRYYLGRRGRNPNATFLTDFSLLIRFDTKETVIDSYIAD